jgi:hypothetical protein
MIQGEFAAAKSYQQSGKKCSEVYQSGDIFTIFTLKP